MVPCARLAAAKHIPLISTDTPIGSDLRSGKPSVPGVTAQVLVPAITAFASLKGSVLSACKQMGGGSSCHVGFIIGIKVLALSTPASGLLQQWVKQSGGVYVGEGEGGLGISANRKSANSFSEGNLASAIRRRTALLSRARSSHWQS